MNALASIEYLAHAEARHFAPRPLRTRDDDVGIVDLPYVRVVKAGPTRYDVAVEGHEGHVNAPRADVVADFLRRRVLPSLDPEVNASGLYPIELHDSYTYLAEEEEGHAPDVDAKRYRGALAFSKDLRHRHVIMFPDPYQICGYKDVLGARDAIGFDAKPRDAVFFAGTTTGSREAEKNVRIQACRWALTRRPDFEFYITRIAQMRDVDFRRACGSAAAAERILHAPVAVADHFAYKYQMNLPGNTACWARVPMIMNSQSLMLHLDHPDGTWYCPLLHEGTHFAGVRDLDALPSTLQFCRANPHQCKFMIENSNTFVKQYCNQISAAYYAKCLLEAMAQNT